MNKDQQSSGKYFELVRSAILSIFCAYICVRQTLYFVWKVGTILIENLLASFVLFFALFSVKLRVKCVRGGPTKMCSIVVKSRSA